MPLQYEGAPLYQGVLELPAKGFVLGDVFDETMNSTFDQAVSQAMVRAKANVMSAAVATKKTVNMVEV